MGRMRRSPSAVADAPASGTGATTGATATDLPLPAPASVRIDDMRVSAYTVPTEQPESDGTLEWDRTTIVIVELSAGGTAGLGYSYADASAAMLASTVLAPIVVGADAFDVPSTWAAMLDRVRNLGRPGIASTAISAVDNALWDVKARLLGLPIARLLGRARPSVPAYGSGGFTSYADWQLADQLAGWVGDGFTKVKIKIGRHPDDDLRRMRVARDAIGPATRLFVDANGAFDRRSALATADWLSAADVRWFEEPVSSDDVAGLRWLRDRVPGGLAIAAGEYGWDAFMFRTLLERGAVDVLQADATRCLGTTGFLQAVALCEAHGIPLSTHCAPSIHAHLACAARPAVHVEWFHDHVRLEQRLFDGGPEPHDGRLTPDPDAPGFGLTLRAVDAARFLSWRAA
jgi:L-alanine-DL-glutamate epimerase-like enolase superfamily enzyme